ncbi:MAG TPA: DivIVA domain-containing protein [Lapillicoccus sp.]|jgi:cell division septum initiation protein DivIVA|uniref:DivIVA domain-containing protein n=1 Tax=Lapillicoccus sp. TaxID=1909287 RepID=UPI002F93F418
MTDAPNDPDEEYYPEFRTVRRGYDPDEVEQVLDELYTSLNHATRQAEERADQVRAAERGQEELRAALSDAQRRIAELESRPAGGDASFERVGSRVSEILGAAAAEAAEITRRAHDKAQALHDESEASSVTSRAEANHYASDIRERAEREAVAITATAHTEAERILADARVLRESQHRADAEAYARLAAEQAERQAQAEAEFATTSAAHEQRLASLTGEIAAATEELDTVHERASAQRDLLLTDARADAAAIRDEATRIRNEALEHRARVRAQLAEVRERLARALLPNAEPSESAPSTDATPAPRAPALTGSAEPAREAAVADPDGGYTVPDSWSSPGNTADWRDSGVRR